jgi:2-polyprenyl-6-hydroxyphenyl methylase/3-demethylubiquinone-9 3-methyltransferase
MALSTRQVAKIEDVQDFFDALAPHYRDIHGKGRQLLRYRLEIIHRLMAGIERGSLLEIGCGTGLHLFPLAGGFSHATGIDLSPAMIDRAKAIRSELQEDSRIELNVDRADQLKTVDDNSMDVVLCVGAFEHMHNQKAVVHQVERVLKRQGAFICLTPNADWIWYSKIAPRLKHPTTHLSTDHFVGRYELIRIMEAANLNTDQLGNWTFIPRGDIRKPWSLVLGLLDVPGRLFKIPGLRGGLYCRALKP